MIAIRNYFLFPKRFCKAYATQTDIFLYQYKLNTDCHAHVCGVFCCPVGDVHKHADSHQLATAFAKHFDKHHQFEYCCQQTETTSDQLVQQALNLQRPDNKAVDQVLALQKLQHAAPESQHCPTEIIKKWSQPTKPNLHHSQILKGIKKYKNKKRHIQTLKDIQTLKPT